MKKLFSVAVAVLLALCMSICVFAADEIEIPLDAEHVGASSSGGPDALTIENGTLTANDIALFSLVLPENVPLGDTVVVHLKGTSDGDFRVWLLGAGETDERVLRQPSQTSGRLPKTELNSPVSLKNTSSLPLRTTTDRA